MAQLQFLGRRGQNGCGNMSCSSIQVSEPMASGTIQQIQDINSTPLPWKR